MSDNNAERRGEGFEQYVERQFRVLRERISNIERSVSILSGAVPGLQADVDQLAQDIPAIAQGMSDLHTSLVQKEEALTAEIAKEGQDKETIIKLEGELAGVATAKAALDPLVQQANALAQPASGGAAGEGAGAPPAPLEPPAQGA